jgi:hypothetical protein
MFGTMSNTEAVQMIGTMFIIGTVAMLVLVLTAVFLPEAQRGAAALATWASERSPTGELVSHELGLPGRFREPADLSYVDELIRIRGRAPIVYAPDPLPELLPAAEVLRYVLPITVHSPDPQPVDNVRTAPVRVANPYSPYRVQLAELVASVRTAAPLPAPAGRHRRALVAA